MAPPLSGPQGPPGAISVGFGELDADATGACVHMGKGKHTFSHVAQVELVNHAIPQTRQCDERTLEELADVNGLGDELEETLLLQLP